MAFKSVSAEHYEKQGSIETYPCQCAYEKRPHKSTSLLQLALGVPNSLSKETTSFWILPLKKQCRFEFHVVFLGFEGNAKRKSE